MTDFRDKLNMFESNKITPPQIKSKPPRKVVEIYTPVQLLPEDKNDDIDSVGITITDKFGGSEQLCNKILDENEPGSQECYLSCVDSSDCTYIFLESVYDLPGFEHFIFDSSIINPIVSKFLDLTTDELKNNDCVVETVEKNQIEIRNDKALSDIQLAPSPKLIEEIFNTSIWRNSDNFSDDFIFDSSRDINVTSESQIDISNGNQNNITQSALYMDDRRKTQSSGRRSIFSSIFKSKKGSRKSSEKLSCKDNDSIKDFNDKNKSISKNPTETDDKSLDLEPKKPLNSIFNRDWLNSIGDGIKKKATVMSELRKVFSHGHFKHFKKISTKNSYDINV